MKFVFVTASFFAVGVIAGMAGISVTDSPVKFLLFAVPINIAISALANLIKPA